MTKNIEKIEKIKELRYDLDRCKSKQEKDKVWADLWFWLEAEHHDPKTGWLLIL